MAAYLGAIRGKLDNTDRWQAVALNLGGWAARVLPRQGAGPPPLGVTIGHC